MARQSMTLGEHDSRGSNLGCAARVLLALAGLLVLVLVGLLAFRAGSAPEVSIDPQLPGIGRRTPVAVHLAGGSRGLGPVRVELVQGPRVVLLGERASTAQPAWKLWGGGDQEATLEVEAGRDVVDGLTQGDATVRVTAERPGAWLRHPDPEVTELTLPVRLSPPSLAVTSDKHYVTQGGSEVVVYRVGDSAVKSGVQAGEHWFPGHPLPGGERRRTLRPLRRALRHAERRRHPAGGRGRRRQPCRGRLPRPLPVPRPYAEDDIQLSEAFMARVVPEIVDHTPGFPDQGGLLANYLYINGTMRDANRARIAELSRRSQPEMLWHRPFLPMPNAAVMATFATHRTYFLDGQEVDEAFHLGYDLATVKRDEVPAANDGIVLLAEYFGIYGNAVILDHGDGLLSLYGHMSSFDVAAGDHVERGQTLGRTGQTGLAGGDHLHFGIFLDGLAVEPKEWWDPHWIQDRIARKLGPAWNSRSSPAPTDSPEPALHRQP